MPKPNLQRGKAPAESLPRDAWLNFALELSAEKQVFFCLLSRDREYRYRCRENSEGVNWGGTAEKAFVPF